MILKRDLTPDHCGPGHGLCKIRFNNSLGKKTGQFYWPFENLFRFVQFTEKLKTLDILSTPVPRPGLDDEGDYAGDGGDYAGGVRVKCVCVCVVCCVLCVCVCDVT